MMGLVESARLTYNDRVTLLAEQCKALVCTDSGSVSSAESASEDHDWPPDLAQTQLNSSASEFVPTCSQSLNANASVFTPSFVVNDKTCATI